jgi:RimJ/RimL family protein N-acetyltransferase
MEIGTEELIGRHVRLAALTPEHREGLLAAARDPRIWAYMPSRIGTGEEVDRMIASALAARDQGTEWPFTIFSQSTGEIVGSTRLLDIMPAHKNVEIGWTWLNPSVWRTAINTECKYLLLRHCFEDAGAIRVQLKTDARNERSQRAIERIGGVKEGVLRRHRILWDGFVRDSVYYSVLDHEWPAVKARLEEMLDQ